MWQPMTVDILTMSELSRWLDSLLKFEDHFELCKFIYNNRHSEFVSQLRGLSKQQDSQRSHETYKEPFSSARHYIGRLAHHIRSSKGLCDTSRDTSHILETFEVQAVTGIIPVSPPPLDRDTDLHGILNRMFNKNNSERLEAESGLFRWSRIEPISQNFVVDYQNLHPLIHAEVQVLEYFHRNSMNFAGEDAFIACSKAACFCCEMYFQYHPARVVLLESHQNIWTNWSPPCVSNFSKSNPAAKEQLDVLNKMVDRLRELTINQILGKSSALNNHPDSRTGITEIQLPGSSTMACNLQKENPAISFTEISFGQKLPKLSFSPHNVSTDEEESDYENGGVPVHC